MLKVLFSQELPGIVNTNVYFNTTYENDWFEDDIVKQIIRDIDKSEVNGLCVLSPVLGSIAIEKISEGAKALILMYKDDNAIVDLISCGNNCQEWIIKLSKMKDIVCCYNGVDLTFKDMDISAICLNDDSEINGYKDWIVKMLHWWNECEEEY